MVCYGQKQMAVYHLPVVDERKVSVSDGIPLSVSLNEWIAASTAFLVGVSTAT
ncbi:hypothetical protein [Halobacillus litoralis]|uniref:hypothetical protein n=1 Tax=Halobacillus litoralis TaxID=45668 RepID=UPI001CFC61F0|nr:hypothetical protein [Halobacillus litoralis]